MSDFLIQDLIPICRTLQYKANHDVNAQKYHTEGVPGFWSEVTNLLIVVAIIAIIFLVIRFVL